MSAPEPESSEFGLGTLLLGALVLGGGIWLVTRLFRRSSTPAAPATGSAAPDFLPNRPNSGGYNQPGPGYNQGYNRQPAPDFLPNRGGGSGSAVGGMLMTGAAAAAGAYLGNRMASAHDTPHPDQLNPDAPAPHLGYGAAGPATSGGFPALDGTGGTTDNPAPDYFSENTSADSGPDYFSSDESSSYDDPSSGDSGGAASMTPTIIAVPGNSARRV
ncbi:hypothetical protein [Hymenobacter cellulosilyticus]|uniref:Uncharacterized protein n=1 Tax=Hymenobacter cellulosilyticus TaxID=2932248 RepID=A0A8T9QEG7_9BACT|nr:hypothetical protein [Hymenobacter cellulosilyticus]UOQ73213.1 hypothetical protein MUN79_04375 [Hymenobacter cellulosilyticus]